MDGSAATQKSPIAKSLSEKFDLIYLEIGAIYRSVTVVLLTFLANINLNLKKKISKKPKNF
ncbi:MAG: (d)CMP kinase [Puniceicoccales bacterium]|nr:(d)CMP kinase [Puniceicoccales bacterium]